MRGRLQLTRACCRMRSCSQVDAEAVRLLMQACSTGNLPKVKELLASGTAWNELEDGITCGERAAVAGHLWACMLARRRTLGGPCHMHATMILHVACCSSMHHLCGCMHVQQCAGHREVFRYLCDFAVQEQLAARSARARRGRAHGAPLHGPGPGHASMGRLGARHTRGMSCT